MKKILFILSYSLYLAVVLGFVFHTSSHSQILGRYTVKYLILLIVIILGFFPFIWSIRFLQKTSTLKYKKRKVVLDPIRKVLILIILLVILVAPFEIFLRNKFKDYESNSYTYTLDNFNPFLQSQISKQENLTVNSLGFRGEEISKDKPANTYRIAILGGSTVLNREVPFEDNVARVLEKQLRTHYPEKRIEVINAGKDYYTSEHSLIQYMFKIKDLNPDLVIMWHGANDMQASCLSERILTHGEYKNDYSHLYGAIGNIVFNYFRPQPIIQIKLITFDLISKVVRDNLYSDLTDRLKEQVKLDLAKDYLENKNTVSVREFPSIEAYKRNLLYLVNLTKEEQIPLILGNQPSIILKSNNSLDEIEKIVYPAPICKKDGKDYDLDSLKYGLALFNKETQAIAQSEGVEFANLDKVVPKNLDYYFDAFHYTNKGNLKVADNLYSLILERGYIK